MLADKVAITLEASHALDVLEMAFSRHGTPEIVNTDRGSQFAAAEFVEAVKDRGCKLSMDGKGGLAGQYLCRASLENCVKYLEVYLYAYNSVSEACRSIMWYLDWYNYVGPPSA